MSPRKHYIWMKGRGKQRQHISKTPTSPAEYVFQMLVSFLLRCGPQVDSGSSVLQAAWLRGLTPNSHAQEHVRVHSKQGVGAVGLLPVLPDFHMRTTF